VSTKNTFSVELIQSIAADEPFRGVRRPEFAFAGRSNVGKSSLINLLTGHSRLAHVSSRPGKTQTVNYYLVDRSWYLVDLPGYGYARRSKQQRERFGRIITDYLLHAQQLYCVFVLLDCRLPPQSADVEFINWLGENQISLALVFTKADKISANILHKNRLHYEKELLTRWETLPPVFVTSARNKTGRDELLAFIGNALKNR
jgi:GTP-binding protein